MPPLHLVLFDGYDVVDIITMERMGMEWIVAAEEGAPLMKIWRVSPVAVVSGHEIEGEPAVNGTPRFSGRRDRFGRSGNAARLNHTALESDGFRLTYACIPRRNSTRNAHFVIHGWWRPSPSPVFTGAAKNRRFPLIHVNVPLL